MVLKQVLGGCRAILFSHLVLIAVMPANSSIAGYQVHISPGLNKIKAFSEFQLFAVLLVCTLMQANLAPAGFAGELIGMDGYGEILKFLTMMILPVTLWFTFCAGDADAEKEPELVAKKEAKQAKKLEKKSSRKGAKQKQKEDCRVVVAVEEAESVGEAEAEAEGEAEAE